MSPGVWIAGLAVALALAAALLWLAIGWIGYWRLNRPPRFVRPAEFTFTPWETDAAHEVAEFTTADGVRLHGWFLRHEDESRVVVVMHGYRGEKSDVLGMSTALWRAGFDVLLFDFRGRGRSARAPSCAVAPTTCRPAWSMPPPFCSPCCLSCSRFGII